MSKTPFDTLGLPDTCTLEDVERRWKQLASEFHPDKGGDAEKFIEYREAYQQARLIVVEPKPCRTCNGSGKITKNYGFNSMSVFCDDCGGIGEV